MVVGGIRGGKERKKGKEEEKRKRRRRKGGEKGGRKKEREERKEKKGKREEKKRTEAYLKGNLREEHNVGIKVRSFKNAQNVTQTWRNDGVPSVHLTPIGK